MKDILQSRWKFLIKGWSIRKGLIESLDELEQLKADNQVGREGLRLAELEIAHLKTKLAHAEATSEKKHNYVRKLWGFIAASRRIDIPASNGTIRAALERAQRTIVFILCLLPMIGFSQALQRQFFTTNTAPNVVVTAGTNAFITFSLVGQQRTYRVDTPASGTATNIVWPVQGTNVYLTTNGLAIVIDVPSPLIPWQAITNITSIQIPAAAVTNAPWSTTGQTNLALTIAGTNVFVHSVTNLGVTTYTIDVPLQPQQTNWSWQSITNIATVQIPYSAITNPPAAGGQTNLALVVSGTNVFVSSVTNLGVTTFTIDVPATGGSGQTNVTLVVQGTNSFVHSTTNLGVITYTIDVPMYVQTNIAWQAVTNISTVQIPYTAITNAPWTTTGQTNLALVVAGTNAFVTSVTNLGVTTFTVDGPAIRTNWAITDITNSLNLTNWALLGTNLFLPIAGGTSTGPQLTTSASTNAPAGNEFVTGAWVRGLINQGFFEYASTNIISGTNADSPNQFLYEFHMQHIPDSAVRVWPNTFLTNGGYVGSVSTTNTFQSIAGQILVNAYIGLSSGGGDALSLKPEIYLSTDRSNWYGDFDCSAQAITPGITQLYSFVVSFPAQTATNPAGFYIERRLKVTSKGGSPTMYFLVGTNAISGTNSASHISINAAPVQGGAFVGTFIGDGSGITNAPYIEKLNGTGTNTELFSASAPALKLHGGFLSTNDTYGSIALQTNGTLQLSNASVAAVVGTSNVFQIDTVPNKKALQVDTNGVLYANGAGVSNITFSAITNPPATIGLTMFRQTYWIFDDFIADAPGSGPNTSFSPLGLHGVGISSGTIAPIKGTTNAPGIWQLSSTATPGSGFCLFNVSSGVTPYIFRGVFTNETRFRINLLNNGSVVGTNYQLIVGFNNRSDGTSADNGVYLQYDTNNANFVYVSAAASTRTTNATSLTPVINTWYKFRAVVTATASLTNAVCTVDDAQSQTFSNLQNVPTANSTGVSMSIKTLDSTNIVRLDLDYSYVGYTLEATR